MRKVLALAVLVSLAVPAFADSSTKDKKSSDPNKVVCKSEEVIGSRLQSKRTCLTRQQWDQMEREQRATVDHLQAFRPSGGN